MYDAMTIILTRDRMAQDWNDKKIKKHIDLAIPSKPDIEYCGWIKNMFIAKKQGKLCIIGSLTKFWLGYNDQNAGIDGMRSAARLLSDILQLPIDRGYIRRIEVGFNLSLNQPVEDYLLLLNYAYGYREIRSYPSGKVFSQKEMSMAFYDKQVEAERNGHVIERDSNILRYELRLRYPSRLLARPGGVFLFDLLKTDVANKLMSFWVKEYFRIVKNRRLYFPVTVTCLKDFSDFVRLVGANALGGEPALHQMIDTFYFPYSNNGSKIRTDMRKSIERMHSNIKLVTGNTLESELDASIMQTAWLHSL
jgi:hypothetical protein